MKASGNVFSTFLHHFSLNDPMLCRTLTARSKTPSDWLLVQLKLMKIILMNICIVHYDVNWYCRENSQWTDSLQRAYESCVHTDWFSHSIWLTYLNTSFMHFIFWHEKWNALRCVCGLDQRCERELCSGFEHYICWASGDSWLMWTADSLNIHQNTPRWSQTTARGLGRVLLTVPSSGFRLLCGYHIKT